MHLKGMKIDWTTGMTDKIGGRNGRQLLFYLQNSLFFAISRWISRVIPTIVQKDFEFLITEITITADNFVENFVKHCKINKLRCEKLVEYPLGQPVHGLWMTVWKR